VSCSPGGVADSLELGQLLPGMGREESEVMCPCIVCRVQDVTDIFLAPSAVLVLCLCFSQSGERK
jgi:hypothetical protein